MNIIKAEDYNKMSRMAANFIAAQVTLKPDCVLGLATGSSPVGTYQELIRRYESGELDFSKVTSINLDEYKGLSPENDQSYRYFMNTNLFYVDYLLLFLGFLLFSCLLILELTIINNLTHRRLCCRRYLYKVNACLLCQSHRFPR